MIPKKAIEKPATRWQRTYLLKHPWMKHLTWARSRAKRLGRGCTLTAIEIEELWDTCEAERLSRPSLDRIDPKRGYSWGNCRFIELSDNCRRDKIGRSTTDKQREASRRNLTAWHTKK